MLKTVEKCNLSISYQWEFQDKENISSEIDTDQKKLRETEKLNRILKKDIAERDGLGKNLLVVERVR